jgi:hypothetical protein
VTSASFGRDGDIEAFVMDRYLESLLAREPIEPDGVPPDLARTARRLAETLPRYHPSFRFEEALAAKLAAVAGRIQGGEVVILSRVPGGDPVPVERSFGARPVVIGGVLTSAALSLAGAAFVAWRLSRPPAARSSRALRAVIRARPV